MEFFLEWYKIFKIKVLDEHVMILIYGLVLGGLVAKYFEIMKYFERAPSKILLTTGADIEKFKCNCSLLIKYKRKKC